MAAPKCGLCDARFDVPGAVGTLDQHMASFHPGASKGGKATAAVPVDVRGMEEVTEALGEAAATVAKLEARVDELEAENADLREQLAAATEAAGGSAGNGDGPEPGQDDEDLAKLTKPELAAIAEREGVDLSSASNNPERAAAIAAARAARS